MNEGETESKSWELHTIITLPPFPFHNRICSPYSVPSIWPLWRKKHGLGPDLLGSSYPKSTCAQTPGNNSSIELVHAFMADSPPPPPSLSIPHSNFPPLSLLSLHLWVSAHLTLHVNITPSPSDSHTAFLSFLFILPFYRFLGFKSQPVLSFTLSPPCSLNPYHC